MCTYKKNTSLASSCFFKLISFFVLTVFFFTLHTEAQQVAKPSFDKDRGFYDASFVLTITPAEAAHQIVYTLDGSDPGFSGNNPLTFSSPIPISKTTIVRARSKDVGGSFSDVVTYSYIFISDVVKQPASIPGYPSNMYSLGDKGQSVVQDYEMDPNIVNNPLYTSDLTKGLKEIPTFSIAVDSPDIENEFFGQCGFHDYDGDNPPPGDCTDKGEKKVSFEIISDTQKDLNKQLNALIEGHSHVRLKRSFRINFKKSAGGTLNSDILKFAPLNGDSAATAGIEQFVLRSGNNRSWARNWNPNITTYTEDQWYRDSQIAMSCYGSHGTFAHLYINGIYWGLYNIAERPTEAFHNLYYKVIEGISDKATPPYSDTNLTKDNFFNIKADPTDIRYRPDKPATLVQTASARWNYFVKELLFKDMTVSQNYEELKSYLDTESFIDLIILSWYNGMTDWPGNNWFAGYQFPASKNGVTSAPTRIKFFGWDAEWSWDTGTNYGTSETINGAWVSPFFRNGYSNPYNPNVTGFDPLGTDVASKLFPVIYNALKVNSDFMTQLNDRLYKNIYNDGALTDNNAQTRWLVLNNYIKNAIIGESARWGDSQESIDGTTRTRDIHWQAEVTKIANLIKTLASSNAAKLISAINAEGYLSSLQPPTVNLKGGTVNSQTPIVLSNPNASGQIYYTVETVDKPIQCSDSVFTKDPRAAGGGDGQGALLYTGPFTLPPVLSPKSKVVVRARVKQGMAWSPVYTIVYANETLAPTPTAAPAVTPTAEPTVTALAVMTVTPKAETSSPTAVTLQYSSYKITYKKATVKDLLENKFRPEIQCEAACKVEGFLKVPNSFLKRYNLKKTSISSIKGNSNNKNRVRPRVRINADGKKALKKLKRVKLLLELKVQNQLSSLAAPQTLYQNIVFVEKANKTKNSKKR
jgi:hypothetical protein